MQLKNLCPHDVEVGISPHETIVIPKSDTVARIRWWTTYWKTVNEIPIHHRTITKVEGLPKEKAGVLLIVSNLIQEKLGDERNDLVSPDRLSAFVTHGKVKSVEKLVRWI